MRERHVLTVFKWKEALADEIVWIDVSPPTMKLPQDAWNWMNERRYELRLQRLKEMERMERKEKEEEEGMSSRVGPVSEAGLILLAFAASIAFPVLVKVFKQFGGISLDLKSPDLFGHSVEFLLSVWRCVIQLFSSPTSLAFLIALGIALAALELRRR